MSKEEILSTLIELMKELCPNSLVDYSKVTINSRLKEDLNFDSLSMLLMAIGIENKFNIKLSDIDYQTINNVSHIVEYIHKKMN